MVHRVLRGFSSVLSIGLSIGLLSGTAAWGSALFATRPALAAPQTKSKPDAATLRADLESGDEIRMLRALSELSVHGSEVPEARELLCSVLERGAPLRVIEAALVAATAVADAGLSETVARYTLHRSPSVRLTATRTLAVTGGPVAVAALRSALRSADSRVRGAAADGLGKLGARKAVPELFLALDRRVLQAAGAIGRLCAREQCLALSERLGKVPLAAMTAGIDPILLRPAAEIPDDDKINVIGRVAALGTADAARYLVSVAQRWPAEDAGKARQALRNAIESLGEKDPATKKP